MMEISAFGTNVPDTKRRLIDANRLENFCADMVFGTEFCAMHENDVKLKARYEMEIDAWETIENHIKQEPTFMQWISVNDRKPKVNEPVLIALYGEVFEGFYAGREVWCEGTEDAYFEIDDPEAWMPMPDPPEME